jgi:hypothetical protein
LGQSLPGAPGRGVHAAGQPQQWPAIRQILLTLSPELPVIVPVAFLNRFVGLMLV